MEFSLLQCTVGKVGDKIGDMICAVDFHDLCLQQKLCREVGIMEFGLYLTYKTDSNNNGR